MLAGGGHIPCICPRRWTATRCVSEGGAVFWWLGRLFQGGWEGEGGGGGSLNRGSFICFSTFEEGVYLLWALFLRFVYNEGKVVGYKNKPASRGIWLLLGSLPVWCLPFFFTFDFFFVFLVFVPSGVCC